MALRALDNESHRPVKIIGKKDLAKERLRARELIDRFYVPRIQHAMGPKFALYREKASLAKDGLAMSKGDDPKDIMERFNAHLQRIAVIEDERQEVQARIDNAASSVEINKIVEGMITHE